MIFEMDSLLDDQASVEKNTDKEVLKEKNKPTKKSITEAYKRSKLSDSEFGIPSQRKFPLHDKAHVISAIKMFNYVDDEHEKELASNIRKKMASYKMTNLKSYIIISEKNRFHSYWYGDGDIKESTTIGELYDNIILKPVYIVTVYTGSAFGKIIKAYTRDTYSHAALGLDHTLSKLYSFNAKSKMGKNGGGGLSTESLGGYVENSSEADMQVTTVFLKEKDYRVLKERLEWFEQHAKDTMYDMANVLNIVFNRVKINADQLSMVCSEFVEHMFNIINVDLTGKSANLTTPGDLSRIKNPKAYKIFEGKARDYNIKYIEKKMMRILAKAKPIKELAVDFQIQESDIDCTDIFNSIIVNINDRVPNSILEAKEFPIQFDDNGNLLIKNYRSLNYEAEYYKSVKILNAYKSTSNIEGIKYELSKLWFISEVLIKKIDSTRTSEDNKTKYLGIKKKVLNTFSQYLKIVTTEDTVFNFTEYYENTPFSSTKIKINGATLKYGARFIKSII